MLSDAAISAPIGLMMILHTVLDWIYAVIVMLLTAILHVAGGYVLFAGAALLLLFGAAVVVRRAMRVRAPD
jgi:hypothetical protein